MVIAGRNTWRLLTSVNPIRPRFHHSAHKKIYETLFLYLSSKMTLTTPTHLGIQGPPPDVKGMSILNREAFRMRVSYPALRVETSWIKSLFQSTKRIKLHQRKVNSLIPEDGNEKDETGSKRLLLLNPKLCPTFDATLSQLDSTGKSFFEHFQIQEKNFTYHSVELNYDCFDADTVLRWILPEEVGPVVGFTSCGHVLHLNLKEHHWPYKKLIGQVFLDKVPTAKTVVNKTSEIDSVFRNFEYEILAGENNLITSVRESDCSFELDYSKVYWNSRLSTEHDRVVSSLPVGAVVYDVFAGVGPFAIPAAKAKKCRVFANDLNPDSFKWLSRNVQLNDSKRNPIASRVHCYNMDGREFLRNVVLPDVEKRWREGGEEEMFVVMNLPALAVEFLDVFGGCLKETETRATTKTRTDKFLTIFCYSFSKADDVIVDTKARVESRLGIALDSADCAIRSVRNVAPNKWMTVARFKLSEDYLTCACSPAKKIKLSC